MRATLDSNLSGSFTAHVNDDLSREVFVLVLDCSPEQEAFRVAALASVESLLS
jgi:hypothetical protein